MRPTWPTDGPPKKRQVGHRKAMKTPAKMSFGTKCRKTCPEMQKGIRGGDNRTTLWYGWPAQPAPLVTNLATLIRNDPSLTLRALTADADGQPGYRQSCHPHPCPRCARVPRVRAPGGSPSRIRSLAETHTNPPTRAYAIIKGGRPGCART